MPFAVFADAGLEPLAPRPWGYAIDGGYYVGLRAGSLFGWG